MLERIDSTISRGRQHFSDYDINELGSRIHRLKQQIAHCTSNGLSGLEFQDDVAALEGEVSRRVDDSLLTIGSTERQLTETLNRVEQLFFQNKGKMTDADREELSGQIARLREKSSRDRLVGAGLTHSSHSADCVEEARKIETAIISKTLFHKAVALAQPSTPACSTDYADGKEAAKPTTEPITRLKSGVTAYRLTPVLQTDPPKAKTELSLAMVFEKTENRLIDLHEKERLGTFDIDVFTDRILKLKYDSRKMASSRGTLTRNQERWLRDELGKINEDISERGHKGE